MLATRTKLRPFLRSIRCRTFVHSCARWNTAADVHRSKEVGAAAETQDVTAMDALLKATRAKASPSNQRLIPVRSRGKWQDTLRLRLSSSPSSPSPSPSSPSPSTTPPTLEPRHMSTSYTETILPFHSSSDLLEAYTNTSGGIRTGMLMEHLDNIAGSIAYKYMLGDSEGSGEGRSVSELGYYIVTASVDRLDMLAPLYPVRDLRLSGQVIHVGRSSMEIVVRMEALEPGHTNEDAQGRTVMLGRFCMVCRDSKTHKARAVNPLVIESEEDRRLNAIGEAHKNRRHRHAIQSLARVPPSSEEAAALHALYLQSTSPSTSISESEGKRVIERVKMEDTRVEKTLTMYPQERNVHQKIFGGYLMRLAYELGYTNSMLFTRGPVRFLSLDSIAFAKPVPIGSVLHLTSHILHTVGTERYPTLIHVGVKATVIDIKTGLEELTNDFRFTWCKEEGEPVARTVVPMTYQEAMWWIEGKRALDLGAEIRGIRQRQRQW